MGFDVSKVGEQFILGFHGKTVPDWLRDYAKEFSLGGVIFFDYYCQTKKYENNIYDLDQVKALCAEVHELNGTPLIFIDQEGGKVRRLKESRGFENYPSQKLFNTLSRQEKLDFARASFTELQRLGIDFNLAPVVDLDLNRENSDIGKVERSYSGHTSDIRENVKLVAQVAKEAGIQLCLKHYPGVGGAKANAHEELTDLTESYTEEQEGLFHELVSVIPGGAILVSHGINNEWEPGIPASVSTVAVSRIRERNEGVLCITDDIHMEGLQRAFGSEEATLRTLGAGMDLVLIGNNMRNEESSCVGFAESVIKKAETDSKFRDLLDSSRDRIRLRKQKAQANRTL